MIVEKLKELGYDGADIHWLHRFYDIGLIVQDPREPDRTLLETRKKFSNLAKLVEGGDKFYIDQAIEFGRVGLCYEDVIFKTK